MHRRYENETERLLDDTFTIYVSSNLASPLARSAIIEINRRDTIRQLVSDFWFAVEQEDGVPGLAVYDDHYNKLDWNATLESQGITDKSLLHVVHDKASFFQPVHVVVIGIIAICVAVVLFIAVSVLFATTGGDIPFDFGVVIDAGSTHTEVYLYEWSGSKYLGTGEVNQKDFCTIESGITEGFDPAEIISCVNNLTNSVPRDTSSPIRCYLGATAGMRLLNESNALEAHLILTAIKYALKSTSVKEGLIEIIQGQDEGLFSWITTNFLSKALINDLVNDTYGALDLGGASTQLAFASKSNQNITSSDIKTLKLYGHEHHVLSKSFLCFGLSQAADRSKAITFMEKKYTTIIDPCLPKNYSFTLQARKFLEGSCIQNTDLINWLEKNGNIKELHVIGSSDYNECKTIVKQLINPDVCKSMKFSHCLDIINLAEQNKTFMAFSSFFYIANYLRSNGSLSAFENATRDFCSLSYEEIRQKTKDRRLLSHLLTYCFGAVYITELLTSNYGFNSSTWSNIIFQQTINGTDVGWALGFMINATNAILEETPRPPVISLSTFIPLVTISALMIFFALILLQKNVNICKRRQREALLDSVG